MYSCYFSTMTPHILSPPSFVFLQTVHDCVDGATATSDPNAATCLDICFHKYYEPLSCDVCGIVETCHNECLTGDTCMADMYAVANCLLAGASETCTCAAAFETDVPYIESLALNLAYALKKKKKNLRA